MNGRISSIGIASGLLRVILDDARRGPVGTPATRERCGLLTGNSRTISGFAPAANVHAAPARHFELDPAVLVAAMRAARTLGEAGGQAIIGHYHSHPAGGAAQPSAQDAADADKDLRLWLVVTPDDAALWQAVAGGPHCGAFTPVTMLVR